MRRRIRRQVARNFFAATLSVWIALMVGPLAGAQSYDPAGVFAEASKAYDEDRLSDAIAGWERLLHDGQTQPEVLYNLGNAYYRNGNLGPAIRAYRHAQTLAPRDPDIQANLGFAAQTSGVDLPERPRLTGWLLQGSLAEWTTTASVGFWLTMIGLGLWMVRLKLRWLARPMVGLGSVILLMGVAGLLTHRGLKQQPEWVIMEGGHSIRSGPIEGSTPLLAVPEGAIVRQMGIRGEWLEIQFDSGRGWIRAGVAAPVLSPSRFRPSSAIHE